MKFKPLFLSVYPALSLSLIVCLSLSHTHTAVWPCRYILASHWEGLRIYSFPDKPPESGSLLGRSKEERIPLVPVFPVHSLHTHLLTHTPSNTIWVAHPSIFPTSGGWASQIELLQLWRLTSGRHAPGLRKHTSQRQLLACPVAHGTPSSPAKSNCQPFPEGCDLSLMKLSSSLAFHPVTRILSFPYHGLEPKRCFWCRRKRKERWKNIPLPPPQAVMKSQLKDYVWLPREERRKRKRQKTFKSYQIPEYLCKSFLALVIMNAGCVEDSSFFLTFPE